jgi:hypothetical protein
MTRVLLLLVLVAFGGLTAVALQQHGLWGILAPLVQSTGPGQVFADLVIALTLVIVWMVRDAHRIGRNPWPWVAGTLLPGSFGPLLYLLTRREAASEHSR